MQQHSGIVERGDLLIVHGGGPTAVLNCSLYGAITEAQRLPQVARILGAVGGTGGYLAGRTVDLTNQSAETLQRLPKTPGSAIGTSRDHMTVDDYERFTDRLEQDGIRYVLFNGGNGTMETCGRVFDRCTQRNNGIRVMGIPKTMDNDIWATDHCPGFGSAARYIATSVAEVCADVKGLPIHVTVIEASGRNAGWITAASALAVECGGAGPDLIYVPERSFDEEAFLQDVKELIERKGCGVVVASEGLQDREGRPVVEPIFQVGRATYFGDVSAHLANLIIRKLGYKARGEKPGLLGRASIAMQSPVDRDEAILAGAEAARAVVSGESGCMVAFRRTDEAPYRIETFLVPIAEVMLAERTLPDDYLNERGNGVTKAFLDWCRPLVGELPSGYLHFN